MDSHPKWRLRARAALETYFSKRSYPRFTLGLLVTVAGFVGLLISHILLRQGLDPMWQRYPIAVIGGYAAFLIQLRLWVEIERGRFDPNQVSISTDPLDEKPPASILDSYSKPSSSWLDVLDLPDLFSLEEGCLVGCLFALVVGLAAGVATFFVTFIMAGSELLAEVFLDAVVVTMLYRHLKTAAREHWLGTAVKRTWIAVLLTAAALGVIGGCLGILAPHSHSIGPALKEIFSSKL